MLFRSVDKKRIIIGYFYKKEDAIVSRLKAELKYFQDFAPQKHLFNQYNITKEDVEYEQTDTYTSSWNMWQW